MGKSTKGSAPQSDASRKRLLRALALAERLLIRRLERALHEEGEIDRLLELSERLFCEEHLSEKARRELLSGISSLRCEDLSKPIAMIASLYERQRGMAEEGSVGQSEICRFEDL